MGVRRTRIEARRIQREQFSETVARSFRVAGFDVDAACAYARLLVERASIRRTITAHVFVFVSTELSRPCADRTTNVRHFNQVPGLIVRQPNG